MGDKNIKMSGVKNFLEKLNNISNKIQNEKLKEKLNNILSIFEDFENLDQRKRNEKIKFANALLQDLKNHSKNSLGEPAQY